MAYRWLGVLTLLAACSFGCENSESGDPRGEGGTGGSGISCATSALCLSCPREGFCETNDDCSVGLVCIESGCDSLEGLPDQAMRLWWRRGLPQQRGLPGWPRVPGRSRREQALCPNHGRLQDEVRLRARLLLRERELRRSPGPLRRRRQLSQEPYLRWCDELVLLPAHPNRLPRGDRLHTRCTSL